MIAMSIQRHWKIREDKGELIKASQGYEFRMRNEVFRNKADPVSNINVLIGCS